MKDRLFTLLGALVALYLVYLLLFPKISLVQERISLPTTEDRGRFGLAGLYQWLDTSGVAVLSLRERYNTLINNPQLPERGNLLIISLPLRLDAQANELEELQLWVNQGNNLLLLTAMSDWPQWAQRSMSETLTDMLARFSLVIDETPRITTAAANRSDEDTDESGSTNSDRLTGPSEQSRTLIPAVEHPLTRNVQSIDVHWLDSEGIDWQLRGREQLRSTLILLHDQADQGAALWLGFYGQGKILVSRHSDMFGNDTLGKADNARLLDNIIGTLLGPGGQVIFDDMHHGLTAVYDPDKFFRDPRLHHTLLFLFALWVIYVMGHTNRLVQVRERLPYLQLRDHVTAIGNLFAQRLHSSAVALRHAQHFFNDVRSSSGLPQNGQPIWELLADNAAIDPRILRTAQGLYQRATQHKKVNLIKFFNSLRVMRRELT